ncbi:MAG: exodeoxyribonuclease VII small subunit [Anaerolineae bacterium]
MMNEETLSFEDAYARLEQILEKMNSGKASLDESLKLYEEADHLIASCTKRLSDAEKKIEMLIKQRNGDLVLNEQGKPATQEFVRQ